MIIHGRVHKYGDDINTDEILPAKYLNLTEAKELARHCLEGIDQEFTKKISSGDILVAGNNFGCGSSREQAPLALKTCGLSLIIAQSFARIFYRNAINIGLPILVVKEKIKNVSSGDELEVNLNTGEIRNLTRKETYQAEKFPSFMQEIISAGGLLNYVSGKKKRTACSRGHRN